MAEHKPIDCWMTDMDGVLVREGRLVPGADTLLGRLRDKGVPFLVLTNNSMHTPRDLRYRLQATGLEVPEESIWTSALATAAFLHEQRPGGSAYVIGEAGLTTALHDTGYVITDAHPDYVVLGETRTYSFSSITTAIRLIEGGSRGVAANPDAAPPAPEGQRPAPRAGAPRVTKATPPHPYFIGKPNPLMMRAALNRLGAHSESTVMIGDRMDTDILAGLEAGMRTILVLSGITQADEVDRFPFRPTRVVSSVADLVDDI